MRHPKSETRTRRATSSVCYNCETGTMRVANLRGREFAHLDQPSLVFNEDLEVPVCDTCGDMRLRGAQVTRLSAVLERLRAARKRQAVAGFVTVIREQFGDIQRHEWEGILGLSRGYLSRLESGTRTPDTALEIVMQWVARDKSRALRVLGELGRLPASMRARLGATGAPGKRKG